MYLVLLVTTVTQPLCFHPEVQVMGRTEEESEDWGSHLAWWLPFEKLGLQWKDPRWGARTSKEGERFELAPWLIFSASLPYRNATTEHGGMLQLFYRTRLLSLYSGECVYPWCGQNDIITQQRAQCLLGTVMTSLCQPPANVFFSPLFRDPPSASISSVRTICCS